MPEINEIIAKFKEITKTKCIGINTTESKTGPFESSFGGTPYFQRILNILMQKILIKGVLKSL